MEAPRIAHDVDHEGDGTNASPFDFHAVMKGLHREVVGQDGDGEVADVEGLLLAPRRAALPHDELLLRVRRVLVQQREDEAVVVGGVELVPVRPERRASG